MKKVLYGLLALMFSYLPAAAENFAPGESFTLRGFCATEQSAKDLAEQFASYDATAAVEWFKLLDNECYLAALGHFTPVTAIVLTEEFRVVAPDNTEIVFYSVSAFGEPYWAWAVAEPEGDPA